MSRSRSHSSTKAELSFELSLSVQLPAQLQGPRSRSCSTSRRCLQLQTAGRALTHRQRRDSVAPRAVSLSSPAHGSAGRAAALPGAAPQKLSARREPADRSGRPALFPLWPQGAGGHGSRTRVSPQPPSASTGPGRAAGRRHDAGGEER